MQQKLLVGVVVIAVVLGGYCVFFRSPQASPATQPAQTMQKVTIAEYGEVFLYAPLYVAQEKGFFAAQGLDVNIVAAGGPDKTFAALLSGDAQFGVADPTFSAISGEKGQPGEVVASIVNGVPFWGLAKDAAVPTITDPVQLKHYVVTTSPAPSTAYTLQKKMFQDGGLQPNIKESASGTLLATMDAGQADIALEMEPTVSAAVKKGDRIVYALSTQYPDFALTGLTVLPGYAEKHPETVQKAVNALQEAMTYIRSNPSEAAAIMIKRFPSVERDVAESSIRNMVAAGIYPERVTVTKAGWEAATLLRKSVGDIKGDAPYATYVVTSFSAQAK